MLLKDIFAFKQGGHEKQFDASANVTIYGDAQITALPAPEE
ncbi:MAG TPA: hypothetical protein VHE59_00320 [Mucilaginibacter sp.]|nr:hypothetical protein [Mucilaginibacter sp.]